MISEAQALQIAGQALENIEHAGPPYEISRSDGSWLVGTSTVAGLRYRVRIDDDTGEAAVEAYQYVVVDEEL